MAGTRFLACIDAVYAASLDPGPWPEALARVSEVTSSVGALPIPVSPAEAVPLVVSERLAEANRDYGAGWSQYDSRVRASHRLALRPGLLLTDAALFTPEEIARDPFYQESLRRHGLGFGTYRLIPDGAGALASVSLQRQARPLAPGRTRRPRDAALRLDASRPPAGARRDGPLTLIASR